MPFPNLRRRAIPLVALLFSSLLLGCAGAPGDAPDRVVVYGKVTYAGDPVEDGTIRFVPEAGEDLPVAVGVIADGEYRLENKGGVPVGEHRVEITATRPDPSAEPVPDVPPPQVQYLPPKYNQQSQLEFTVPASSDPVSKDFALEQ